MNFFARIHYSLIIASTVTVYRLQTQQFADVAISAREVTLSAEEQLREFLQRAKSGNYVYSPYKCALCYRGFVDPAAYEKHKEKHDEVRPRAE